MAEGSEYWIWLCKTINVFSLMYEEYDIWLSWLCQSWVGLLLLISAKIRDTRVWWDKNTRRRKYWRIITMLRPMLGSVPGCWLTVAERERERHFRSCAAAAAAAAAAASTEPNSCQPRTLRRPTPRLQNSKFQPQPQLVNMTAGESRSRSPCAACGGQF